jgi:P4 family phage/plasmid primase-like protien
MVESWWHERPKANIGIATGSPSGLVVIDVDPRNGGDATLVRLEAALGKLPATATVETGGGGLHLYFRAPSPPVATTHGKLGPGLDVQAEGAYVVAPPSLHVSGQLYRWREGLDILVHPPATLPEPWLERLRSPKPRTQAETTQGAPTANAIPEGQRNTVLTSIAGKLRHMGLSHAALLSALRAENELRCKPALDGSEVERIVASVMGYPAGLAAGEDRAEQVMRLVLDQRFAGGKYLLYATDGQFWAYDGRKWSVLLAKSLERTVLEVIRGLPNRSGQGTAGLLKQVMTLLAASQAIDDDRLHFLSEPPPVINCANGELWIGEDGTVELQPHRASSYLRHCLEVSYDPGARCPVYDEALAEIFGGAPDRDAMVRHWHELSGYIIQPRRPRGLVLILQGRGANAKTSLMQTTVHLLGSELVSAISIQTLDQRFAVGGLLGKRLLLDDDLKKGVRLSDDWLKKLSEAKELTGEHKFGRPFNFKALVVPVLLCNDPPSLPDLSHGMVRRLMVIPFERTFAEAEQDHTLFPKIWANEMSGVLNRALAGLRRVVKRGWRFERPESVRRATEAWLAGANPLPAFLEERCERKGSCLMRELYEAYTAWARESGITQVQQRLSVKRNLDNLGFKVTHGNRGLKVLGLRLRS